MGDEDAGRYPVEAQRDNLLADDIVSAFAIYPRRVYRVVNAVYADCYVRCFAV